MYRDCPPARRLSVWSGGLRARDAGGTLSCVRTVPRVASPSRRPPRDGEPGSGKCPEPREPRPRGGPSVAGGAVFFFCLLLRRAAPSNDEGTPARLTRTARVVEGDRSPARASGRPPLLSRAGRHRPWCVRESTAAPPAAVPFFPRRFRRGRRRTAGRAEAFRSASPEARLARRPSPPARRSPGPSVFTRPQTGGPADRKAGFDSFPFTIPLGGPIRRGAGDRGPPPGRRPPTGGVRALRHRSVVPNRDAAARTPGGAPGPRGPFPSSGLLGATPAPLSPRLSAALRSSLPASLPSCAPTLRRGRRKAPAAAGGSRPVMERRRGHHSDTGKEAPRAAPERPPASGRADTAGPGATATPGTPRPVLLSRSRRRVACPPPSDSPLGGGPSRRRDPPPGAAVLARAASAG